MKPQKLRLKKGLTRTRMKNSSSHHAEIIKATTTDIFHSLLSQPEVLQHYPGGTETRNNNTEVHQCTLDPQEHEQNKPQ